MVSTFSSNDQHDPEMLVNWLSSMTDTQLNALEAWLETMKAVG